MQLRKNFKVFAVPLFSDNYSYIIKSSKNSGLLLVDPANPEVILHCLQKYFSQSTVNHILYTHKHWDHAGGAKQLCSSLQDKNPKLKVFAGLEDAETIGVVTNTISGDYQMELEQQGLLIQAYKVPCHTRGHTLFYLKNLSKDENKQMVPSQMITQEDKPIRSYNVQECCFTGDTLFSGGVGKFFEGNASEMYANLQKINGKLPVLCPLFNGHEYTLSNMKWGTLAEPSNLQIQNQLQKLSQMPQPICTLPSNLQKQRKINVFLRSASQPQNRFKLPGQKYLHILRQAKNANAPSLQAYLEKL